MITKLIEAADNKIFSRKIVENPDNTKYKILGPEEAAKTGKKLQSRVVGNYVVYRIQALKDFSCQGRDVHAGDLGGFVSCYDNLAIDDNSWIFDNAAVSGKAVVNDDSIVEDEALVTGLKTIVTNGSEISGHAKVSAGYIWDSTITDNAIVSYKCTLSYIKNGNNKDQHVDKIIEYAQENHVGQGDPNVQNCQVEGNSKIVGRSNIDDSTIRGDSVIYGSRLINSIVEDNAILINARLSSSHAGKDCLLKDSYHDRTHMTGIVDIIVEDRYRAEPKEVTITYTDESVDDNRNDYLNRYTRDDKSGYYNFYSERYEDDGDGNVRKVKTQERDYTNFPKLKNIIRAAINQLDGLNESETLDITAKFLEGTVFKDKDIIKEINKRSNPEY